MKSKKGQQEIIVTVLLVLIAIAAIVLISNFVINMVKDKTAQGTGQVACLGLDFTVNRAMIGETYVTITRGTKGSDVNVTGSKVLVGGQVQNTSLETWESLSTKQINVTKLTADSKITIAPVLKGGFVCEPMAETAVKNQ
jgi:flagellin-like protein